jgi:hypothetical protein
VNNYGVWVDEFRAVGMEHTLELTFPDAQCWFGEGHQARKRARGCAAARRGVGRRLPRRGGGARSPPGTGGRGHAARLPGAGGGATARGATAPLGAPPPPPLASRQVSVGRAYGRVSRRLLRAHLLQLCASAGVRYLADEVAAIDTPEGPGAVSEVRTAGGAGLRARLVALASGQAAGRFLRYEEGAPEVAAQTAYGIEADVEG